MAWHSARGLTLIEVVISTLLIAGLMVAAMNAVGASVVERERSVESVRGQLLADSMLDAIAALPYTDPGLGLGAGPIQIDADDGFAVTWGQFDDVDDFEGWSAAPPEASDGSPLNGYTEDWDRSVRVRFLDPETLAERGGLNANTGIKKITVTVSRNGRVVGEASAVRTRGADEARAGVERTEGVSGDVLGAMGG